jgi:hypothetical protein
LGRQGSANDLVKKMNENGLGSGKENQKRVRDGMQTERGANRGATLSPTGASNNDNERRISMKTPQADWND